MGNPNRHNRNNNGHQNRNNNQGQTMQTTQNAPIESNNAQAQTAEVTVETTVQKVEVPAEALKPKSIDSEPAADAPKPVEKKRGVIDLVMVGPKFVYDKGIVPVYMFMKGIALKIWQKGFDMWEREKALFNELGAMKYILDRTGKLGLKALKIAATVTLAYFLSEAAMTYGGFNLFSPVSLGIIAFIALACIIAKSIMAQKDSGAKVEAGVTGSHVMEAVLAA
jgi:hypothetical protein